MFGIEQAFTEAEHQAFHWDGGEKAALLIHGFPGTPAEMRPIADILHQDGWTVRGVLLPGFGSDIENILEYRYQDWVEHVRAELQDLKQTHAHVTLIGYSMGGAIATVVASQEDVDSLILFSPFIEIKNWLWHALPVIRVFIPKIKLFKLFKPDFSDPQTREGIQQFMPDADLDDPNVRDAIINYELPIAMFNEIRGVGQKADAVAETVTARTLVFQGLNDDLVQAETTQKLVNKLPNVVDYVKVESGHEIIDPNLPAWSIIVDRLQTYAGEKVIEGDYA